MNRYQAKNKMITRMMFCLFFVLANSTYCQAVYEISGSPFATDNAPIPQKIRGEGEKIIVVDPKEHVWGAYSASGKLIRWGIATAGANFCRDVNNSCRTNSGYFRIYSMGGEDCISHKYPLPDGGAPMPYCMYFNGSVAIHGSSEVEFQNISHGCIRIHIDDAKWLRFKFVEAPNFSNHYQGTKVIIKAY